MIKSDFNVTRSDEPDEFYIENNGNNNRDGYIASALHIDLYLYQEKLLTKYNAFKRYGEIYFKNKEDATKALEWINSLELLVKLRGV